MITELEDQTGDMDVRLSDVSDIASRAEMAGTLNSLAEARRRMRRDQEPNEEGVYPDPYCGDCGDEIGLGRLQASIQNTLCIFCAIDREARKKTHG